MKIVLAVRYGHARLALEVLLSEEPGVTVVGTASEMEGMLALAQTAQPDLIVFEWDLPGRPAEAALAAAHARDSRLRFLVLSCDPALKPPALHAGACAFVLIGEPPDLLLTAVRQVRDALQG